MAVRLAESLQPNLQPVIFISNGPKFPKFAKGDWGGHLGGQSSLFGAYSTAITTSTPHEFTFLYRFCPQTTYNMLKRRLRGVCRARNFAKSWRLKGLKQKEKFAQKHPQNRQWRLIAQKKITAGDSSKRGAALNNNTGRWHLVAPNRHQKNHCTRE